MILKASQRGGGKALALHLLNAADNEQIEVHEVRGFVSQDLPGAMEEAHVISKFTQCRQYLFSVSLNPPQGADVPVSVFEDTAERIEQKTGLTGQPRVIVFHEKEGRRHAHCVWSRINAESMTAINLPFYKTRLNSIAKELYQEHSWQMPKGFIDKTLRDPRNYGLAEYQQAKRMGRDPRALKTLFADCWAASDSRTAFAHALEERGFILARGDKRGHIAISPDGEPLAITRYTGHTAKNARARLGDPESLPTVAEARQRAAQGMAGQVNRLITDARKQHARALYPLEQHRLAMAAQHRSERQRLKDGQTARWEQESRIRGDRLRTGLRGLLDRVTGRYGKIERQNMMEAQAALRRDREQQDALRAAQMTDRRLLQTAISEQRDKLAEQLRTLRADRLVYQKQERAASREMEAQRGEEEQVIVPPETAQEQPAQKPRT
ncbi:MAG: relaxase/mobilization nuclease domain-containing protein, partial [Rhodospirillaceae bacterium]